MPTRVLLNSVAGSVAEADSVDPPSRDPLEYHRQLPGYEPTVVLSAPATAQRLGVANVWVKDESSRLTMPSYKIHGASWAIFRTVPTSSPSTSTAGRRSTICAPLSRRLGR